MIHHWKGLDLEITDFNYHDLTPSGEVMRVKKAKLEELSNIISEKRCELKANEPVSERSEWASGDIVGYMTGSSESES